MRKKYSTNKTLTEKQRALLAENTKLVGSFIQRYWPKCNKTLREELFAEGNSILCERIHSFRPSKGKYSTWAYRVLSFCLRNSYNKRRYDDSMFVDVNKHSKFDEENESGIPPKWAKKEETTDAHFGLHENEYHLEQQIVKEHFAKLSPLEQKIVMMFMSNYSAKDISKECKIPPNKVYYIKDTAIAHLRRRLKVG